MRKRSLLAAVLAVCLAVLCACSAPASSVPAAEDDRPVLNIGTTTFAPYFYTAEDGSYAGVDYEIALEACARMGYRSNFVLMDWANRDSALASGSIDCIWNCFIMTGREDEYQWAGPYLNSTVSVLVSADSNIQTISDLAGKTVALRVNSRLEDFFLTNEHAPALQTLATFSNMRSAFTAFGKGYASAFAEHTAALKQLIASNPDLYRILPDPLFTTAVGVGFAKDADSAVVDALDRALREMQTDGTIATIAQKYDLAEQDYPLNTEEGGTHEP